MGADLAAVVKEATVLALQRSPLSVSNHVSHPALAKAPPHSLPLERADNDLPTLASPLRAVTRGAGAGAASVPSATVPTPSVSTPGPISAAPTLKISTASPPGSAETKIEAKSALRVMPVDVQVA